MQKRGRPSRVSEALKIDNQSQTKEKRKQETSIPTTSKLYHLDLILNKLVTKLILFS
jgi:hypothetical protein